MLPSTLTSPASISALSRVRESAIRCGGRRLSQETVEPLACARRIDVENLQPFGRDERRKGRGLNRRAARLALKRLGRMLPGAPLGFCVHVRSRRRCRPPPVSAAGGATRGPSAATIASTSGRAPGLRASSPRRIAATWAGLLPQQPPMMRAPQSDGQSSVFLHQLRRAGIVDMRPMPLRHAGVGLGDQGRAWPHRKDRRQEVGGADAAIRPVGDRRRIESFDKIAERGGRDPHHRAAGGVETGRDRIRHAALAPPRAPPRAFPPARTWSRSRPRPRRLRVSPRSAR